VGHLIWRIPYRELDAAEPCFAEDNVPGFFGKKGTLLSLLFFADPPAREDAK
jgi:hypothetical protein